MPLNISKAKKSNEKKNEGKLIKLTKKKVETKKSHQKIPLKKDSPRSLSNQDKNESSKSSTS